MKTITLARALLQRAALQSGVWQRWYRSVTEALDVYDGVLTTCADEHGLCRTYFRIPPRSIVSGESGTFLEGVCRIGEEVCSNYPGVLAPAHAEIGQEIFEFYRDVVKGPGLMKLNRLQNAVCRRLHLPDDWMWTHAGSIERHAMAIVEAYFCP